MLDAPEPALGYLALMIATFALHLLCIGFVLAGTGYVAAQALRGRVDDPLAMATRDWLPFALGVGITAGVAPLLFVQVLYQPRFYTANLLLFLRWLAIVPALIVGFYGLYLGKSARVLAGPRWRRAAIAGAAWLCFVFVGWTWVENHALSLAAPGTWAAHYQAGALRYRDPVIGPRLVLWLGVAAAVWPAGLRLLGVTLDRAAQRTAAVIALGGLAVAIAGGVSWFAAVDTGGGVTSVAAARPWAYLVAAIAAVLAGLWLAVARGRAVARGWLVGASVALVLALAIAREAARVAAIDPRLAIRTGEAQGLWIFVAALVVGGAAIGWCLTIARRAAR